MSSSASAIFLRIDGDRIDNHPALTALYAIHFLGLPFNTHIAMHNADAALLRKRDGQVRLGNSVHGRAEYGNVQPDSAGELRARICLRRDDGTARRLEKYVVKSKTFSNNVWNHEGVIPLWRECRSVREFETMEAWRH